jgi:hypothetical protein
VTIFLLLRSVNAVTGCIHSKAVHHLLDRKILELAKVLWIVFLIHGDGSAGASSIYTPQSRIKLDHICTWGQRKVSNCMMRIECKHGYSPALATKQKRAVSFRVECHTVIELTTANGILADDGIG